MANAQATLTALADSTRRALVDALRKGPLSVGELARRVPVTRSAVSQHLKVLAAAHLVEQETLGTRRMYRLHPATLRDLRKYVDRLWGDALSSFAAHADADARSPGKKRK